MKAFGSVLEAGERVGGASVETVADEELGDGAAPAFGEGESAVVVDAALLQSQRDAVHVFVNRDAEWEVCVEDEAVVCGVDLEEAEREFEVQKAGAGFGGDGLSGYGRTVGVDG